MTNRKALPITVAVIAGLLVMFAAVVLPILLGDDADDDGDGASSGTGVDTSNLALVEEYDVPPYVHVREDVDYPQSPPVGGDHWDPYLECGAYDVPVRNEYAVHDLEHGTVWLTYRPDLVDADGVAELAARLPDNGIMSPREGLATPVVVTVWGAQLALDGARDERLALFLGEYGGGHTAPEIGVTCHGGTPDPSGDITEPGVGV
jgi:hypothetical protein